MKTDPVSVKVYHGYGHTHKLTVYGHVFSRKPRLRQRYRNRFLVNILYLIKLYLFKPAPFARVRLRFREQEIYDKAEYDGFFRFEFSSCSKVEAGWHQFSVEALLQDNDVVVAEATGLIYVPHITHYAFISDIDDTVMVRSEKRSVG